MGGFVSVEDGGLCRDPRCYLYTLSLVLDDKRQRPSAALAERHHNAALAGLVFGFAAVDPVLDVVPLADCAADIAAVNLDMIVKLLTVDLGSHGFAELVRKH